MFTSTLLRGFSVVLEPRARTSIRVERTPFSIRNDRIDKARDKDIRRALLDDKDLPPAKAINCSRRVSLLLSFKAKACKPFLAFAGILEAVSANTTCRARPVGVLFGAGDTAACSFLVFFCFGLAAAMVVAGGAGLVGAGAIAATGFSTAFIARGGGGADLACC